MKPRSCGCCPICSPGATTFAPAPSSSLNALKLIIGWCLCRMHRWCSTQSMKSVCIAQFLPQFLTTSPQLRGLIERFSSCHLREHLRHLLDHIVHMDHTRSLSMSPTPDNAPSNPRESRDFRAQLYAKIGLHQIKQQGASCLFLIFRIFNYFFNRILEFWWWFWQGDKRSCLIR